MISDPNLLVDTNLLWKHQLRNQLTEKIKAGALKVYLPTLMHAERIRQIADQRGEAFALHIIQQLVDASGFELLPLTVADAEAVAEIWLELKTQGFENKYWKENRFDILLCAIARSRGYTLVTDDTGDHFDLIPKMPTADLQTLLQSI